MIDFIGIRLAIRLLPYIVFTNTLTSPRKHPKVTVINREYNMSLLKGLNQQKKNHKQNENNVNVIIKPNESNVTVSIDNKIVEIFIGSESISLLEIVKR